MIIDITNEIYTTLKTLLTGVDVRKAYPKTVPSFPCVIFQEIGNSNHADTHDTAGDHHSDLMFEVNIFSQAEDPEEEIKGIRTIIDTLISGNYNMNRDDGRPLDNLVDNTVTRYILRYSATIDSNKKIYRG